VSAVREICEEAVRTTDGGLVCSVVELPTGRTLGRFPAVVGEDVEKTLAAVSGLLCSAHLPRVGELVRSRVGLPSTTASFFDEVYCAGGRQLFAKILPSGGAAVILATELTTPVAWGWLRLRSALRALGSTLG
jgi:hypothetical protein